jgi:prepilin-type N-terminal cleavage/methylation domain-containing protein/prepilin-type processing-associated H-X9-DG protein
MPRPFAASSARRAFTLIELLTVIAIIGVLAAILIPTIGKVRESARTSQCLSNQRQIALAFGLYAGENKGYLPRAGISPENTIQTWMISIKNYLPTRGNVIIDKVYHCPAAPQPPEGYANSVFHYSASFALEAGNSATTSTGTSGNGPRTLTSIVNPARTILLVDGAVDPTTYRANSSRTYTNVDDDFNRGGPDADGFLAVSFRHGDSMNAAFVDGHVAKIPWSKRREAIPDIYAWNGKQ